MSLCKINILSNYDNVINKEEVEGHILFRDIKTYRLTLFHVHDGNNICEKSNTQFNNLFQENEIIIIERHCKNVFPKYLYLS